ncbi:MAG: family 16 glycoside hydrolase [Planctomycetota bacterium]
MKNRSLLVVLLLFAMVCAVTNGCSDQSQQTDSDPDPAAGNEANPNHDSASDSDGKVKPDSEVTATEPLEAKALLVGGLGDWKPIGFGGEGEVYFEDGALNLDYGNPLTGVKYRGDMAELLGEDLDNYRITLQAQRVEGIDIFLGVTFPVGQAGHVSLVLGGWAGAITGISNLDGLNASENKTTQYHAFEDKKWYTVKIEVTIKKIQCWLDDKQLVDVNRADYTKYDTHGAVVDTIPFGMFSYGTWGKVKDVRVVKLD